MKVTFSSGPSPRVFFCWRLCVFQFSRYLEQTQQSKPYVEICNSLIFKYLSGHTMSNRCSYSQAQLNHQQALNLLNTNNEQEAQNKINVELQLTVAAMQEQMKMYKHVMTAIHNEQQSIASVAAVQQQDLPSMPSKKSIQEGLDQMVSEMNVHLCGLTLLQDIW